MGCWEVDYSVQFYGGPVLSLSLLLIINIYYFVCVTVFTNDLRKFFTKSKLAPLPPLPVVFSAVIGFAIFF